MSNKRILTDRSKKNIITCKTPLQRLAKEVIKYIPIEVICGHRNEKDQNTAHSEKRSNKKWPDSKHNKYPSEAFDFIIVPLDWTDYTRWIRTGYFILGLAAGLGIKVRWGADWNTNYETRDETFLDYGHIELVDD